MRNTLIGGALAIVLVAALFVAAQYGRKPAVAGLDAKTLTPAEIAKGLSPDFVGEQKIGAWKLACVRFTNCRKRRRWEVTTPEIRQAPRQRKRRRRRGWHIPRCRVIVSMRNPKHLDEEIRVTFRALVSSECWRSSCAFHPPRWIRAIR